MFRPPGDPAAEEVVVSDTEPYGIRYQYRMECMDAIEFVPLGVVTCTDMRILIAAGDGAGGGAGAVPMSQVREIKCKLSVTGDKSNAVVTFRRVAGAPADARRRHLIEFAADRSKLPTVDGDFDDEDDGGGPAPAPAPGAAADDGVSFVICGPVQKLVMVVAKRKKNVLTKLTSRTMGGVLSCFGLQKNSERKMQKELRDEELRRLNTSKRIKAGQTIAMTSMEPTSLPADGRPSRVVLGLQGCKGHIELTLNWRPVLEGARLIARHRDLALGAETKVRYFGEEEGKAPGAGPPAGAAACAEGVLSFTVVRATNLIAADLNGTSDPYCVVALMETGQNTITSRSGTCQRTLNPEFGKRADFRIRSPRQARVVVNLYDEDRLGTDDFLGSASLAVKDVIGNNGLRFEGPMPLEGVDKGTLVVQAVWYPIAAMVRARDDLPGGAKMRRISDVASDTMIGA